MSTVNRRPELAPFTGVVGILSAALFAFERAFSYLPAQRPAELPPAIAMIAVDLGLGVWVAVWFLAGLVALVGLYLEHPAYVFGVAAVSFTWSLAYRATWLFDSTTGTYSRDYLAAGTYSFAAVVLLLWAVCQPRWGRHRRTLPPVPTWRERRAIRKFPPIS